jgi:4-hydroxy-tetrahydrodipicolinate synthase
MSLLRGVTIPLVTPMSAPGVPTEAEAYLRSLAEAGARGLMLFGTNGEGPLLPVGALGEFASWAAPRWRDLAGGPVLCTVTAAGTAEVLTRATAVAAARPDALVLSPPTYFTHRPDEIVAHFAALSDFPVVVYNVPKYANPLTRDLIDELLAMPHVVGVKDSSGDPEMLSHTVAAARRREGVSVSQGSETQALDGLRRGADGILPGLANIAPEVAVRLFTAHENGDDAEAEAAQRVLDHLFTLHTVRPGVPAIKAILDDRGLCPPHVAPPLQPCTDEERRDLIALVSKELQRR